MSKTTPALPVQNIDEAAAFYQQRLGFEVRHVDDGFAELVRDDAEVHLWAANDRSWAERDELAQSPVCSGAESFLAGTASCRIEVDGRRRALRGDGRGRGPAPDRSGQRARHRVGHT